MSYDFNKSKFCLFTYGHIDLCIERKGYIIFELTKNFYSERKPQLIVKGDIDQCLNKAKEFMPKGSKLDNDNQWQYWKQSAYELPVPNKRR